MIMIGSYFIVAPIVTNPAVEYLFIVGAVLLGILVYIPFIYYKFSFGCLGILELFLLQSDFALKIIIYLLSSGDNSYSEDAECRSCC